MTRSTNALVVVNQRNVLRKSFLKAEQFGLRVPVRAVIDSD